MAANIYTIRFDQQIEVKTGYGLTIKAYHVNVVAPTIHEAIDAANQKYPMGLVKGVDRINAINGLEVLFA